MADPTHEAGLQVRLSDTLKLAEEWHCLEGMIQMLPDEYARTTLEEQVYIIRQILDGDSIYNGDQFEVAVKPYDSSWMEKSCG